MLLSKFLFHFPNLGQVFAFYWNQDNVCLLKIINFLLEAKLLVFSYSEILLSFIAPNGAPFCKNVDIIDIRCSFFEKSIL